MRPQPEAPHTAPMELTGKLQELLRVRATWYRDLLARIAERLDRTARHGVLRAGDRMPDFVLPNAEGELVFSDALLAQGPLVVCFFRGGWCPFCNATLAAMQEIQPELEAVGARLVAITPDTAGHVHATKQTLGLDYELLSDVDSAVGLRFGLVYRASDEYWRALLSFGIDLEQRHGDELHFLPMPAVFVTDAGGLLHYAHASGDVTDRTEPAAIAALLYSLRRADGQAPDDAGGRGDPAGSV